MAHVGIGGQDKQFGLLKSKTEEEKTMFNFLKDSISVGFAADQNATAAPRWWVLVGSHYVLGGSD